jgi:folate-binding protein YgfZ
MPETRFALLEDRGILAVAGDDRRAFLQGLVSNDTERVSAECAVYAALLTAQGKYLHDFVMVEHDGTIWLDCEAARRSDLRRRLSLYRLRSKVAVDELPDLAVAAIFGEGAAEVLGLPPAAGRARRFGSGIAVVDPRLPELGIRLILPRAELRPALAGLGLVETEFAAYDRLRLGLGVPDGSRDLVVEKSILLESGFDELHGVDWQKGCYIGQELTARTKYRGLIKKRLFPVQAEGAAPPPGAILMLDGREAGEMRSSRDEAGLALLRLDAALSGALTAGEATVVASRPDWMRLESA